jgi:hypothetical protein
MFCHPEEWHRCGLSPSRWFVRPKAPCNFSRYWYKWFFLSLCSYCLIYGIVGGYRFCPQTSLSDALSIFVSKFPFACIGSYFLASSRTLKPCFPPLNARLDHQSLLLHMTICSMSMAELWTTLLTSSPLPSSLIELLMRNCYRVLDQQSGWILLLILTMIARKGSCGRFVAYSLSKRFHLWFVWRTQLLSWIQSSQIHTPRLMSMSTIVIFLFSKSFSKWGPSRSHLILLMISLY